MKEALVIIDVQNFYFYDGPCRLHEPEKAEQEIQKVLKHFRSQGLPVIFIKHLYDGGGYKEPDDEIIRIHDGIKPIQGEYIVEKNYPNSFRETNLQELLHSLGVEKLVMTGMMSHMCVDTSVRAAFDLGYEVTVIGDGCTTMDLRNGDEVIPAETVHKAFMAALSACFAKVISAEEFLTSN